jgi:K+-transporting ATPase ATPase B chain
VVLAKEPIRLRGGCVELGATFVPFTAQTRMSGVDFAGRRQIRKGAPTPSSAWWKGRAGRPAACARW